MKLSTADYFSKCDQIRSLLRIWSHLLKKSVIENLIVQCETDLSLRNKSSDECFGTLVYRLVLLFLSANITWSTWNRSMKTLLMSFIHEAVASIV